MEKRKSERVQIFHLGDDQEIQPVWVFRHTSPEAILGLLVDISSEGVQVLTDKAHPVSGDIFQLSVHLDEGNLVTVLVNHKWSQAEGALYVKSGFSFEEGEVDAQVSVQKVLDAHDHGSRWLRCEVLGLGVSESNRRISADRTVAAKIERS